MDEENLGKLLQAFSNCNYIEFVKVFSMIHGFDATFEFLRNALTTIPFMALKRKFWWGNNNNDNDTTTTTPAATTTATVVDSRPSSPANTTTPHANKRQAIRSTWEDDQDSDMWTNPDNNYSHNHSFDSDHGYKGGNTTNNSSNKLKITPIPQSAPSSPSTSTTTTTTTTEYKSSRMNSKKRSSNSMSKKRKLKFMELPFEMIILIFSYLKPTDLMITSLVSKEWNRFSFISTNELLIDNRNGKSLDIINRKIYKHSEHLKKIRCSRSIFFNSSSLHTIINHCRQVTDLQFYYCPNIYDTHIESICMSLPQLKRLVLHSNHLSMRSIEALTRTKLCNVELGGFSNVADECFLKLGHIATLTSLDVSGIEKDNDFVHTLITCKRLRTLRLAIASEQSINRLPFLENLQWLSIAEWDIDQPSPTPTPVDQQQDQIIPPPTNIDGRNLYFLERCKRLKKLEISSSSSPVNSSTNVASVVQPIPNNIDDEDDIQHTHQPIVSSSHHSNLDSEQPMYFLRDLSNLVNCAEYLTEIDLDGSFDVEYHRGDSNFFESVFSRMVNLESIFLSAFNLETSSWRAFTNLPRLCHLSLCCVRMDAQSIDTGMMYLGRCRSLEKLSLINSTSNWIAIGVNSFKSLLKCQEMSQLRLGGSRGGGWVLNEQIFQCIGKMASLQQLDTSNSRGVSEQCFEYLAQCTSLESLECGIKVDEETVCQAIAEWCATPTLANCKSLKNVSIDLKLPLSVTSTIQLLNNNNDQSSPSSSSSSTKNKNGSSPCTYQFVAKLTN